MIFIRTKTGLQNKMDASAKSIIQSYSPAVLYVLSLQFYDGLLFVASFICKWIYCFIT